MKKFNTTMLFIITVTVICILICLILILNQMNIISLDFNLKNKLTTYTEITFDEYSKMIENNETFILLMGQPNCSHCKDFKPIIEKVIKKYQIEVKYIDISKLDEKDYSIIKNKTFITGTPYTVFIKDGKLDTTAKIKGAKSYDAVIDAFKKVGYINE